MKLESLKDMVEDYERRTKEKVDFTGFHFYADGSFHDSFNEYFHFFPHVGFLFWQIAEREGKKYFMINQTYGNFHKMCPYIREVMQLNGVTDIITRTTRDPRVHQRRWGMKWLKDLDYDYEGRHYHTMLSDITHLS